MTLTFLKLSAAQVVQAVCRRMQYAVLLMQVLASGPSANVLTLADGQIVVAFAPPLYVSAAGLVYLNLSQISECLQYPFARRTVYCIADPAVNLHSCSHFPIPSCYCCALSPAPADVTGLVCLTTLILEGMPSKHHSCSLLLQHRAATALCNGQQCITICVCAS